MALPVGINSLNGRFEKRLNYNNQAYPQVPEGFQFVEDEIERIIHPDATRIVPDHTHLAYSCHDRSALIGHAVIPSNLRVHQ